MVLNHTPGFYSHQSVQRRPSSLVGTFDKIFYKDIFNQLERSTIKVTDRYINRSICIGPIQNIHEPLYLINLSIIHPVIYSKRNFLDFPSKSQLFIDFS